MAQDVVRLKFGQPQVASLERLLDLVIHVVFMIHTYQLGFVTAKHLKYTTSLSFQKTGQKCTMVC